MRPWAIALATLVTVVCAARADFITADVAVYSPGGQYAPLQVGELISDWNRYYWYDVPAFAEEQNFLFWQYQHTGYPTWRDGITTFEVLTDGPVLMASTTRWGGGGNSDGDWEEQLTTREQLEQQGWAEFATGLSMAEVGLPGPGVDYIVFRRDSVAGETFTYRTEKYCPPVIIRSETSAAIPAPSTLVGLVSTGAMGLTLAGVRRFWRRIRGAE